MANPNDPIFDQRTDGPTNTYRPIINGKPAVFNNGHYTVISDKTLNKSPNYNPAIPTPKPMAVATNTDSSGGLLGGYIATRTPEAATPAPVTAPTAKSVPSVAMPKLPDANEQLGLLQTQHMDALNTRSQQAMDKIQKLGSRPVAKARAVTSQVDAETDTARGQLNSMLAEDSDYLRAARSAGERQANSRGLLNSSIAAGAAQSEAYKYATPIAQSTAQTYSTQKLANQDAQNKANLANAEMANQRANAMLQSLTNMATTDLNVQADAMKTFTGAFIDSSRQERQALLDNWMNENQHLRTLDATAFQNMQNILRDSVNFSYDMELQNDAQALEYDKIMAAQTGDYMKAVLELGMNGDLKDEQYNRALANLNSGFALGQTITAAGLDIAKQGQLLDQLAKANNVLNRQSGQDQVENAEFMREAYASGQISQERYDMAADEYRRYLESQGMSKDEINREVKYRYPDKGKIASQFSAGWMRGNIKNPDYYTAPNKR